MNACLSKRVAFDKHVTVFEYEIQKENNSKDFMDWMRQEPRHISPQQYMTSVQNLLEDVCRRQPVTVIYGNLGRYPKLIQYYIDVIYPTDEAITFRIGTNHVDVSSTDEEMEGFKSLIENYEEKTPCDMLFWIEPRWGVTVERPRWARRLIVLSSHLRLEIPNTEKARVVAFHVGNAFDVESFVKIPRLRNYVRSPNGFDYSFVPDLFLHKHVEVIGGPGWTYCGDIRNQKRDQWNLYKNVCADLTKCNNLWEVYLRLLTARDVIRYFSSNHMVKTWSVAIDEDLKSTLLTNLYENKNIIFTKHAKISCNLNGVNTMVELYVNPFLV